MLHCIQMCWCATSYYDCTHAADMCVAGDSRPEVPYWAGGTYRSAARVMLVGHGADEQCAGYGRHRTRFRTHVRPTRATLHGGHGRRDGEKPQPGCPVHARSMACIACACSLVLSGACMAGAQRWEGLADELRLDMARLWTRNLGRDDRILSDTGREVPLLHAVRIRAPAVNFLGQVHGAVQSTPDAWQQGAGRSVRVH